MTVSAAVIFYHATLLDPCTIVPVPVLNKGLVFRIYWFVRCWYVLRFFKISSLDMRTSAPVPVLANFFYGFVSIPIRLFIGRAALNFTAIMLMS